MNMHTILRLNNITAGYGDKVIFKDINLEISDRSCLGVVGPNGGGKTTLLSIMLGINKPLKGDVEYFRGGEKVKSLDIGYLPQQNIIDRQFPISVKELVVSGLTTLSPSFIGSRVEKGQDVDRLLSVLELDNVADIHIGALSGGQMQRALFARAMVSNPELLILDEPDTYMAPDFKAMMPSLIKEINKTCAVVMVSHNFEEISRLCDLIIEVDRKIIYI